MAVIQRAANGRGGRLIGRAYGFQGFGASAALTPDPSTYGLNGFAPDALAQAAAGILAALPAGSFTNPIGVDPAFPWPLPPTKATVQAADGSYHDYYNVYPAPDPSGLIGWTGADSYQALPGLSPAQLLAVQAATGPRTANGMIDVSWSNDWNPKDGTTSSRPAPATTGGDYYSTADLPQPGPTPYQQYLITGPDSSTPIPGTGGAPFTPTIATVPPPPPAALPATSAPADASGGVSDGSQPGSAAGAPSGTGAGGGGASGTLIPGDMFQVPTSGPSDATPPASGSSKFGLGIALLLGVAVVGGVAMSRTRPGRR